MCKVNFDRNYMFHVFHQGRNEENWFLRGNSGNNYPFQPLQLTSVSPEKSRSTFQYGVFPIFESKLPHNY